MKKAIRNKQVGVRFSSARFKQLKEQAKDDNRSLAEYCLIAIQRHMDKVEKEARND